MKNKGTEISLVLITVLSLFVIATAPAGAQPQVNISIGSTILPEGGTATVPIMITEATNELSAAQLNLLYDPTVVEVTVVEDSSAFDHFYSYSPAAGEVRMLVFQDNVSVYAPTTFTELSVHAVGAPGDSTLLDIDGDVYMGTGSPYPDVAGDGQVSITAKVPVFNTFGMIALIGLLAVVLAVKVRKR